MGSENGLLCTAASLGLRLTMPKPTPSKPDQKLLFYLTNSKKYSVLTLTRILFDMRFLGPLWSNVQAVLSGENVPLSGHNDLLFTIHVYNTNFNIHSKIKNANKNIMTPMIRLN